LAAAVKEKRQDAEEQYKDAWFEFYRGESNDLLRQIDVAWAVTILTGRNNHS
jgi:hypothetical protein